MLQCLIHNVEPLQLEKTSKIIRSNFYLSFKRRRLKPARFPPSCPPSAEGALVQL